MYHSKVIVSLITAALTCGTGIGVHKRNRPKTLREKFLNTGEIPLNLEDQDWNKLWDKYQSSKMDTPRIIGFEFFSSLAQDKSSLTKKCNDLLETSVYDKNIKEKEIGIKYWCLKNSWNTHSKKNITT